MCVHACISLLHSHHEQHSWYDEAWVGCIAEESPQEGWQVQVNRLHDHIKHLVLSTADINMVNMYVYHIHAAYC